MYKRRSENVSYITSLFGSCYIKGIVVKIDATDDENNDYNKVTGTNIFDEDTLIVGDNENNVFIVFENRSSIMFVDKSISNDVHIKNTTLYNADWVIHKKKQPAQAPVHISMHITYVQNNFYQLSNNNSHVCNLSHPLVTTENKQGSYNVNGMMSLKEAKRSPNWNIIKPTTVVKHINVCKTCKQYSRVGCCLHYSASNRVEIKMVERF